MPSRPSEYKRGQPRRLLVESRTQQKSFLFLLEEKIRRAQNQKCRENFFAGWRALASGGGAASFVGGFPKMRSDFVQGVEPNRMNIAKSGTFLFIGGLFHRFERKTSKREFFQTIVRGAAELRR